MKRTELIKRLRKLGFRFERSGGNHDIYVLGTHSESVGRHNELNENTCKSILKRAAMVAEGSK